jgi:hypothetical protein
MEIDGRNEKSLRLRTLLVLVLLPAGLAAGEAAPIPSAADPSSFNVRIPEETDAALVRRAVSGAFRSLGDTRCQKVLTLFQDDSGRTLDSKLEALGKTPQEYLRFVLFYDGSGSPACRDTTSKSVFAATATGSRVVLVCLSQFRAAQRTKPYHGESVVIHEMLHSLGLGENPPSSEEISRHVMNACAH